MRQFSCLNSQKQTIGHIWKSSSASEAVNSSATLGRLIFLMQELDKKCVLRRPRCAGSVRACVGPYSCRAVSCFRGQDLSHTWCVPLLVFLSCCSLIWQKTSCSQLLSQHQARVCLPTLVCSYPFPINPSLSH